jgi:FAD/FMN-containing dehydrogenase
VLPGRVSFENSTAYDLSISSYWAAQETQLRPACVVNALTTEDVSKAIRTLTQSNKTTSVPFAVLAGGHGRSGESSIQGGVVINLSGLNSINVSKAKRTVTIGAGAKWGDVYKVLDPLGLTVPGGRSTDVGGI